MYKKPRRIFRICAASYYFYSDDKGLQHLKHPSRTHTAADTHSHQDLLGTAAFAFQQCGAGQALAAHAEGVADGDGAAVDVELVRRGTQLFAAVDS